MKREATSGCLCDKGKTDKITGQIPNKKKRQHHLQELLECKKREFI
jgi:hypothetical protein